MNELKKIRESLNLTQIEVANMLNVSRRTYQKYEALEDDSDAKLSYYIYRLKEINLIDEDHGVLNIEYIKKEVSNILSKYKVNFCFLFGSYAKNKATPSSDIDLLIDTEITGLDYFGLIEELRQSLHKKIDLLNINQLDNNQDLLR